MAEELLNRDSTPADLAALQVIFRRAALTNEGDREWIAAHPDEFGMDEANVIEGRTRVAVVEGQIVGFAPLVGNELEDLFTILTGRAEASPPRSSATLPCPSTGST